MVGRRQMGLPPALALGGVVVNGPDYSAGISEGYWSSIYRVPIIQHGLRNAHLLVDGQRLEDRRGLQRGFDQMRREIDLSGAMHATDEFNRQAVEIITSGKVQQAFDISQEDPKLVAEYGDSYGRERVYRATVVEAGVSFVTLRAVGSAPNSTAYDWDDHAVNWDMNTAMIGACLATIKL